MSETGQETTPKASAEDRFERLIAALTASANRPDAITNESIKAIVSEISSQVASASADATKRAFRPENERHPGHSAFSYAEGDLARPREGILKYAFFYNGFPVHKFPETHHWRELELASLVEPGEYTTIRRDGSRMAVSVKSERDADGKITKISVEFPITRAEKWLVPPMAVVLYQLVFNDNPRKRFVEAMQEHLNMVLGETAA